MTDPLSIVTGVAGLAGFAASVSLELFKLYDAIGETKSDLSNLAQDVSTLASTLEQVAEVIRKHDALIQDKAVKLISDIIRRCEKTIEELRVSVELVGSKKMYLKWLFRKAKTKEQMLNIEGFKSSLNTIMMTVVLANLLEHPQKETGTGASRVVSDAAQRNIDLLRSAVRTNTDVLARVKSVKHEKIVESYDHEEAMAQKAFEGDAELPKSDARSTSPSFDSNEVCAPLPEYNWEAVLRRKYYQLSNEPAVAITLEEAVPQRLRKIQAKGPEISRQADDSTSPSQPAEQTDKLAEEVQVLLEEWTTSSTEAVKSVGTAQGQREREAIPDIPAWIQERYVFTGSDVNNPEHWEERDVNLSTDVKILPHAVFAYEQSDTTKTLQDYLSDEGGCWVWRHEDSWKREYYVGTKKIVQYFMKPSDEYRSLQAISETKTVVSRQWVSKETLQQANYSFKEYGEESHAIPARLTPTEVKELHIASSERAERLLKKLSVKVSRGLGGTTRHTRTVVAIFTFRQYNVAHPGELPFKQGDILELEADYPANGTGWAMAHLDGKSGKIPLNYVRPRKI